MSKRANFQEKRRLVRRRLNRFADPYAKIVRGYGRTLDVSPVGDQM